MVTEFHASPHPLFMLFLLPFNASHIVRSKSLSATLPVSPHAVVTKWSSHWLSQQHMPSATITRNSCCHSFSKACASTRPNYYDSHLLLSTTLWSPFSTTNVLVIDTDNMEGRSTDGARVSLASFSSELQPSTMVLGCEDWCTCERYRCLATGRITNDDLKMRLLETTRLDIMVMAWIVKRMLLFEVFKKT